MSIYLYEIKENESKKESFNRKRILIERDVDLTKHFNIAKIIDITVVRRCRKFSHLYLISKKLKLDNADYCYLNFDNENNPATP